MSKIVFIAFIFCLICFNSLSSVGAELTSRFEIFGSSSSHEVNKNSLINPNNVTLELPSWVHTAELRPDFQYSFFETQSVVLRSSHFFQAIETKTGSSTVTTHSTRQESDLNDFFLSSNWNDSVSTTVGLQNYQWGPAEVFSPSNPFFHFSSNQKSFFFKEKGRVLLRTNWSSNRDLSVVGIIEPVDNQTRYWKSETTFKPKAALKIESQFTNPANSVALIFGQGEDEKGFFGEYMNWSPIEGISLYADVQHKQGRTHYIPTLNSIGLYDMTKASDSQILTLAVLGFRWEGRCDFRQEFILNEAGYSQSDWDHARASATTLSPNIVTNLSRFLAPGIEFRNQAYSYTSLRIPDLEPSKKISLSLRWLNSLSENSAVLQGNLEYNWTDSTVVSAEALAYTGQALGEFRLAENNQISLGFRTSF